jgi:hypothetical protein
VIRMRLGASDAEKLCALGAIRRFCAALNFTVMRRPSARLVLGA